MKNRGTAKLEQVCSNSCKKKAKESLSPLQSVWIKNTAIIAIKDKFLIFSL